MITIQKHLEFYGILYRWTSFNGAIVDFTENNSIQNIATVQGEDYTTGCLLDYDYQLDYHKNYYKMIPINLSTQQALDAHPKAIK